MSTPKGKILKNILFLGSSQGLTWILTTVYIVLVPRYLGPDNVGILAIGLTVSQILVVVATLGNRTFILREVARDPARTKELVTTAIIANVLIGTVIWGGVLIVISQLNPNSILLQVLAIQAIADVIALSIIPIQSAFQGMERMHYTLWDAMFEKGLLTAFAVMFALLNLGIVMVALAGLVAGIPALIFNYWRYLHYSGFDFKLKLQNFKELFKGGMPFFVLESTLQIYMWMGVLLLSIMTNEATVAFYHTPTRLFGTLLFVPVVVGNAILPALCRMAQEDPDNQVIMTRKALSFFVALSLPMAIGTTTLAEPIILTLYGKDFEKAIPVLIFLSWSVIPTYMGIGIVQSLIAQDRQAKWAKVNVFATFFNILINIGLIQLTVHFFNNGAIGTAITLVVTEIGITTVGFRLLTKGTLTIDFFMLVLKTLMATAIMLVTIAPLRDLPFVIPIIVGALTYGLAAIILGIIPGQYLKMALALPRQLRNRASSSV